MWTSDWFEPGAILHPPRAVKFNSPAWKPAYSESVFLHKRIRLDEVHGINFLHLLVGALQAGNIEEESG